MHVKERFRLNNNNKHRIQETNYVFGWPESQFGEFIYHKNYSRLLRDEYGHPYGQEDWYDTVIRNIEGTFSIIKDHYKKQHLSWDEFYWQEYATKMAISQVKMEWLPPGRGLWAMGSDAVYQRGAMPLYNCAYTDIGPSFIDDLCWIMDLLMNGAGVGFGPKRTGLRLFEPDRTYKVVIPDTREGWVSSLRLLLYGFTSKGTGLPIFDYSKIRLRGEPIVTFGGIASGPEPLMELHKTVTDLCYKYIRTEYDELQFKTDLANLIGVCVISGNVRRSAQIACGDADDPTFWELKDYNKNPDRAAWGWMSNNSVKLSSDDDFQLLDQIGLANARGNDVGFINMRNLKHGRIGKFKDAAREDKAVGFNPCGEIPLENREVCNLAETLPTKCATPGRWYDACEYATLYCSAVALLPTHQPSTNAVIGRNRRIGVSIIDFTGWKQSEGVRKVTRYLREGFNRVRETNNRFNDQAGVPRAIRVTTVKPGGTVPKMAGRTSGAGHPTFRYTLRRVSVAEGTPVDKILREAGVPHEDSYYTKNTKVYEFPIEQGPAEPATEVTIWEQAMNVVLLQREWADNAVSNTLYFKPAWTEVSGCITRAEDGDEWLEPKEITEGFFVNGYYCLEHSITTWQDEGYTFRFHPETQKLFRYNDNHEEGCLEAVLAHVAPYVKSLSLLPHTDQGAFKQMPEEGISVEEYQRRVKEIKPIQWENFSGDGEDEKYCSGDKCEVIL